MNKRLKQEQDYWKFETTYLSPKFACLWSGDKNTIQCRKVPESHAISKPESPYQRKEGQTQSFPCSLCIVKSIKHNLITHCHFLISI